MNNDFIINKYIDIIKENETIYREDYEDCKIKIKNSTAIYKGKPIPFLYQPMIYSEEDIKSFEKLNDTLIKILNKVIERYVNDTEFRKRFGFSKELEELILIDPGYGVNVPIGRFDIFYKDKDNFKFCELNADGASAMNEDSVLNEILLESHAIKKLKEKNVEIRGCDETLKICKDVFLATEDLSIAKKIAKGVRGPSGGFSTIRAVGIKFPERDGVVVSMNMFDCGKTPLYRAYNFVKQEATRYGVAVTGSEIVGPVKLDYLLNSLEFFLGIEGFNKKQILETHLMD